ncbi:MAG TPA: prepilin-type N-terminal cleavage/methylation domain-containing protein [Phycisphaerae bacterium]|nr:prepilin-type N-terminal cleavage/methylation domain-containing protein [Phycisphaerae bacterium]HNU45611.1 prepilin-type N-terminal cleavage/methylation domain-containing protein [Phycisphaerae bacterium]
MILPNCQSPQWGRAGRLACAHGKPGGPQSTQAFTLIELIVVISLIAVLLTLLLPSLKRSTTLASSTVCMHNLQQLGYALEMYRFENAGFLPGAETVADGTGPPRIRPWFLRLFPSYLTDLGALTCPEDPFRHRLLAVRTFSAAGDFADSASYGINGFIMTCRGGYLADLDRRRPTRPLDVILAADIGPDLRGAQPAGNPGSGPERNDSVLQWDDGYDPCAPEVQLPWVTTRHGKSINILTAGGAVREARTVDLLDKPILEYYSSCAAGGCTLCTRFHVPHYSFARDRLFWWTGPLPAP